MTKGPLEQLNPRQTHDGWAIRVRGNDKPIRWTFRTTRQQCRDLRRERFTDLAWNVEVVPVNITLEIAKP